MMEQTLERRKRMSKKLNTAYPNHVLVFINPLPNSKNAPRIKKR